MDRALGAILSVRELVGMGLKVLIDAKHLVVENTRRDGVWNARAMRRVLGSILAFECA